MTGPHDDTAAFEDLRRSFILDGPAGTGKSELAFRRFVTALAAAREPEEILLLVPDPEAAADVRRRLVRLLGEQPEAPLARGDAARDWGLAERPWRLCIHTTVTLAQAIVAAAPVSSGCGAVVRPTDDPAVFYVTAVRSLLRTLDHDDAVAPNLETLLLHLDNDLVRAEKLLGALLRRRAELRLCLDFDRPEDSRARLQSGLEEAVVMALTDLAAAIPGDVADEMVAVAGFAARQLARKGSDSAIVRWRDLRAMPPADVEHRETWQGLVELFLDEEGGLRTEAPEAYGFAEPDTDREQVERDKQIEMQGRMSILLARLEELPGLAGRLEAVGGLTDVSYTHRQWSLLQSLLAVLPGAFSGLTQAFRALGEMDLTEIVLGAGAALRAGEGEIFGPNGLCHLIVEDMQDLTFAGMDLIEELTRGWRPGDGRSLFVTGDAFASTRRASGAQPALYLKLLNNGLGEIELNRVTLSEQRRPADIVERQNRLFANDAEPVISEGEMPFLPGRSTVEDAGEFVLHATGGPPHAEGEAIARLLGEQPELLSGRAAVLLGDPSAAGAVIDALRAAGIPCAGGGAERLGGRGVVEDLHSLTRAVCHLADRVAWLSVLRAPWCGLSLADLHGLTFEAGESSVRDLIGDGRRRSRLSPDGQRRLSRVAPVLAAVMERRGRVDLRRLIEDAWTDLGGAACLADDFERSQARDYLLLLERLDDGGEPDSLESLDNAVAALRAGPADPADSHLLVTTIRGARRRVFDTVFLAGLSDAVPPPEADDAMRWLVRPDQFGAPQLLLAPVGTGEEDSAIGRWVEDLRARRHGHELRRLLYVGCSRAQRNLHLVARLSAADGRWASPPRHSLLGAVWDRLGGEVPAAPAETVSVRPAPPTAGPLRRLPASWQPPRRPPPQLPPPREVLPAADRPAGFGPQDDSLARVLRKVLHDIAGQGPVDWAMRSLDTLEETLQHQLAAIHSDPGDAFRLAETAAAAVRRTLDDRRARWFLDPAHAQRLVPLRLAGEIHGRLVDADIDLGFVTGGVRWIVGFYIPPESGHAQALGAQLEALQSMLSDAVALAQRYDPKPLRVGVYCPYTSEWHEWEPAS